MRSLPNHNLMQRSWALTERFGPLKYLRTTEIGGRKGVDERSKGWEERESIEKEKKTLGRNKSLTARGETNRQGEKKALRNSVMESEKKRAIRTESVSKTSQGGGGGKEADK